MTNEEKEEEFKIECSHCGQHLAFDSSMFNQVFQCPACGGDVKIPPIPDSEPTPVVINIVRRGDGGEKRNRLLRTVGIASAVIVVAFLYVTKTYSSWLSHPPQKSSNNEAPTYSHESRTSTESSKTIKLPKVPNGVCIPYANTKDGSPCIYLGAYKFRQAKYNAFYWPEHEYEGKQKKDILFLQFIEFEVLPKLGWTAYLRLEGDEIDQFHNACVKSVQACREANRNEKKIGRSIDFDLSESFPEANVFYFSPDGMWRDFNKAYPGVSFMHLSEEKVNGKMEPGVLLLGFTVHRHTSSYTGQQDWWRNPPYRMVFGLFLDPDGADASPIQEFLDFSNRNILKRKSKMSHHRK